MKKKIAAALLAVMLVGSVSEAAYATEALVPVETTFAETTETETEPETEEGVTERESELETEETETVIAESTEAVSATAEPAADEVLVEMSYDNILQKGGLLKDTSETILKDGKEGDYSTSASVTSSAYKKAAKAIAAACENMETTCDLSSYELDSDDFYNVYAAEFFNSNPRYFYLEGFGWYYNQATGCVTTLIIEYNDAYSKSEVKSMLAQYDAAVNSILQGISASWTDMEKMLYLNDYLARNCAYDMTFASDLIYTAYGVLVNKSAVCQGYALAYFELAQQLGIPCQLITSDSINHAWNMIQINGKYYQVDVTWNDPVYDMIGQVWHTYYMKSTKYLKADPDHFDKDDWVVAGGWKDSYATDASYDSYIWDSVHNGFDYLNGYWYSFDASTNNIAKYSCNGTNFVKVEDVLAIDDVWYSWDGTGYYGIKFVGNCAFNSKFYYSTTDSIYELNLSSKAANLVYTLTDEQKSKGYMYGMVIEPNGQMKFNLAQEPGVTGKVCLATTLSGTSSGTSDNIVGITYQIAFNGNGSTSGSMSAMKNCVYGQEYKLTANSFKKKGYTFNGWNTQKDGSGVSYKNKATVKNLASKTGAKVTLYAQWKKTKYTITYKLDGGTNNSKNPSKYYITTATVTLKDPTKKGYTFKGWYSDKNFKTKVTKIKKGSTGNVTLYAKWSANKYTIKFNGNGSTSGSMKNMKSCKYGTSYKLTKNSFKKKGYTFVGWNTKKDGSGKSYANKASVKKLTSKNGGTVTLYAQWKKTKYTITYNLKGGKNNSKNPSKYYVTTATITLKNPTRKGYTFAGWYSDSKYKNKVTQIKKGSTGNIKLYAKWKKK